MSSARAARPEPCSHENCGSRRFHIGDDGFTYCDQGHQQSERGAVIAAETGDFVQLGRKSRRHDSGDESATERRALPLPVDFAERRLTCAVASGLTQAQALEHYLLCAQLVLRQQLHWLVEVQKFPAELECLQDKVAYDPDTDTDARSSRFFSSQSEGESGSDSTSTRRSGKRRIDMLPREGTPRLLDMLALSCVGMLLLRLPATVADVHEWVGSGALLYYRAARELPLGMRERLPGRYQELLEPQDLLQPLTLHGAVHDVLSYLHERFGMAVPPPNVPLLIYRWMRRLTLPIEVFAATKRLADLLDIDFAFHIESTALNRTSSVPRHPEVRLMAVLLAATKILFPLDTIKRYPQSEADLTVTVMDWSQWNELHQLRDDHEQPEGTLSFEQAFSLSEDACLAASDRRLDDYLSWYEDNIASEQIREHGRAGRDADFRRTLFRLFPLEGRGEEPRLPAAVEDRFAETERALSLVQSSLVARPAIDSATATAHNADVPRPGCLYKRFRAVEDLAGAADTLFRRAAQLAGVPLDTMLRAVLWVESKMFKHEERLRKEDHVER